jgi:hypothetical protein
VTRQFTIDVNRSLIFTHSNSGRPYKGQAFFFQVTMSGWPERSFSWSGHLRSGVAFNSATGVFTGTPGSDT